MAFDLDLHKGRYHVRFARNDADVTACQALRHRAFFGTPGLDADRFDPDWAHLMVCDAADRIVCTTRLRVTGASGVLSGYAAQFYGVERIAALGVTVVEMGRFCSDPERPDPQILRAAWGALTRMCDERQVGLAIGCTSFPGVDPRPFASVFQQLAESHAAPRHVAPTVGSPDVARLSAVAPGRTTQCPMPPLLRSYLAMGGWVSDHAVVDRAMGTLHVFTALDLAKVPSKRAKVLRALV